MRSAKKRPTKSAVMTRVLKKLGFKVVKVKLAKLDPKDLLGFPTLVK